MSFMSNLPQKDFEKDLESVKDLKQLEELRIKYLGRNGVINNLLKGLGKLSQEQRKEQGKAINVFKNKIETELNKKRSMVSKKTVINFDTSLPGTKPAVGDLHPTTQVIRKINEFFRYLGYSVYDGPEIETNEYNFEKLNLPLDHPARELADTLYIKEPELLLRTHTSSVEARALSHEKMPIRIVVPGKVYRNETANPTNNSMFYQYQGVLVDKNVSMANLKGTLIEFVKFLYGPDTKTRFRCKYYPEVEPGAGLDIECTFCKGRGCSVCKYRGYIEALGCGMIHPNLLKMCKIDTSKWSGFAFGMGLDRLVMLQYGISDIRRLYDGSLTFLD
ncbi:phenylalanine--tRNA ligase subunit alpha [Candidatus Roizmanbacteria bacterium RIFCSPLOWO2_12_FULL_40_12]|uniref:Phenylalanine--tRNA ligase alpha subunit n=1 Tax=Candidatus Roizmanbacteria bacterium RIFCSPLOWO2_01_FULL_40_42 TaxID=1802066 RepID=A0A1F7J5M4_9BACT|nr:MAG: phenylalanine--tRNA ligase subunit alpha [Candidatus Roizmanbacteria bacterium RIFCSPHIGHO2_01_FULL_40_98]OGK28359.1 MAG: phenylalanine--tRNA ligase subunit alpha [Candidatus Roizmanbacteria bacterium RIFCSPHIGHO2_02_FULL_40_53]OGK30595.1 MAG: phenylalanine--tRNA ligase subunit alpha [Candidatus Roizmanbacteria bacterium RIFCSPHIGHO2_12_41_18]OGK37009.1 MAG: phenylalanine--tRNA ligase subunit alpha [Candidatus Roizmanbacteria bacterium RIFCSPHIGHO2_12_FULL_40_130]OGK50915.1 MAG: phenyla